MQDADCERALLTRDRETSAGGEDKASKASALDGAIQTGQCTPDVTSAKFADMHRICYLHVLQSAFIPVCKSCRSSKCHLFLKVSNSHIHGCAGTFVEQGEGGRERDLHGP